MFIFLILYIDFTYFASLNFFGGYLWIEITWNAHKHQHQMNVSADLSFYPIRHLDSGSQECPDISAIQNRIKVSSEDLLTLSCDVFTSGLFFFMLNMNTFVFIPEKLYSHLLKMFICVSDGDVRHGSVLWENGQSFTLWFHKNPLCQSVTALCRYILNLLPQPPKLPLQLPLQSPSCPGKFVLAW